VPPASGKSPPAIAGGTDFGPPSGGNVSHPHSQMRVTRRPRDHRKRDAEVVVLARRTAVDRASALGKVGREIGELLISAADVRAGP